jgi:hypothetical protein
VGIVVGDYADDAHPGWNADSFGYQGSDGSICVGAGVCVYL